MLHRDPVLNREFLHDPLAPEAPESAVFLAAERNIRPVNAAVIDVCHSRLQARSKCECSFPITGANGAGEAISHSSEQSEAARAPHEFFPNTSQEWPGRATLLRHHQGPGIATDLRKSASSIAG